MTVSRFARRKKIYMPSLLSNFFKGRDVVIGKPKQDDMSHVLQTGDSVVAVERARRQYEEDRRRQRPREIADKIFEWLLIVVAVVGFGGVIFWSAADLFNKYGIAVPISIIVAVMVVLFANRKRG